MTQERLTELLRQFPKLKIAVVGDLFLDQWYDIDPALDEFSLETDLIAWQVVKHTLCPGAGGTVLNNLRALSVGELTAVSFVGADGDGWYLRSLLMQQGIDTTHLLTVPERMTPSYMKPMFLRGGVRVEGNRLDIKNRGQTPPWVEEKITASLDTVAKDVDAIVILDQLAEADTGVVTARIRKHLAALGEQYPKLVLYADSRARIAQFENVIIKCNYPEAVQALGETIPAKEVLQKLQAKTGRPVFITMGKDGIAVDGGKVLPAAAQEDPIDVCGAGDSATAAIVCALCAGAKIEEAAELGNLAAGVTVRKIGTTGTASPTEMLALYHEQFEVFT